MSILFLYINIYDIRNLFKRSPVFFWCSVNLHNLWWTIKNTNLYWKLTYEHTFWLQLQPTSFFSPGKKKRKKKPVELIPPHWKVKNMEGFSALHWLALRSMDEDSHVEVGVLGDCGKGKRASVQTENGQQWMTLMTPKVFIHFTKMRTLLSKQDHIYHMFTKSCRIFWFKLINYFEYAILVPCFCFFPTSFKTAARTSQEVVRCLIRSHASVEQSTEEGAWWVGRCSEGVQFRLGERWEVGSCKMYVYMIIYIGVF